MQFKYYKKQVDETAAILESAYEELLEMMINIAFEGEVEEVHDTITSKNFHFRVDEFYQFDDPVLTKLAELNEHIEKVKIFLENNVQIDEHTFHDDED